MKNSTIKPGIYPVITIVVIIAAAIIALFVFIGIDKKNSSPEPGPLTLSLISDKTFLDNVKSKSREEKDSILTEAAKILLTEIHTVTDNKHENFTADDFKTVYPVIDFILAVDPRNGHAIYFRGEVYRLLKDDDRFTGYFQQYLDIEDSIGSGLQKVTDARLCYETPHGYCEQRTAWISQLLANYYYNKGINEPDFNKKSESFSIAMKHIQNVRIHFPAGFDSSSVTMSTTDLEKNLKASISK